MWSHIDQIYTDRVDQSRLIILIMVFVLVPMTITCRPISFLGPTYIYSDSRLHANPGPVAERMFLVSESSLVAALGTCPTCWVPCEVHQKSLNGTIVTCVRLCTNGHATTWHNQTQLQRMPINIGNIKLSSSIFASGASPTKVLRIAQRCLWQPTTTCRNITLWTLSAMCSPQNKTLCFKSANNSHRWSLVVMRGVIRQGTCEIF